MTWIQHIIRTPRVAFLELARLFEKQTFTKPKKAGEKQTHAKSEKEKTNPYSTQSEFCSLDGYNLYYEKLYMVTVA